MARLSSLNGVSKSTTGALSGTAYHRSSPPARTPAVHQPLDVRHPAGLIQWAVRVGEEESSIPAQVHGTSEERKDAIAIRGEANLSTVRVPKWHYVPETLKRQSGDGLLIEIVNPYILPALSNRGILKCDLPPIWRYCGLEGFLRPATPELPRLASWKAGKPGPPRPIARNRSSLSQPLPTLP